MENALFDLDSRGWNAHLIYGIFLPFKAQLIKSLSIASSSQEDVLFWPHTKTGLYSVRSGYNILCEAMSNEEASTSNAEDDKRFWKSLEVASAKQGQDFPLESKH